MENGGNLFPFFVSHFPFLIFRFLSPQSTTPTTAARVTSLSPIRILGIDPGLNITGYGVIEACGRSLRVCEAGVVRSVRGHTLSERLTEIFDGVCDVIRSYQPEAMALEELYSHYARPRTAILMGHARGVICLAAAQAGVPMTSYASTLIKKTLTGSGHAGKPQIQRAVKYELALLEAPDPPDVADALALAICHFHLKDKPAALR